FANSRIGTACFRDAEFLSGANIVAKFEGDVDLQWAHFAEEANFVGAEFGRKALFKPWGVRVEKPIRVTWRQIGPGLERAESATGFVEEGIYRTLEDNFRRLGDLESEN